MKESVLQAKILKSLNAIEGCKAIANHQSGYGRRGEPDIFGSVLGRAFLIEVKVKGGRLTDLQRYRQDEWHRVMVPTFTAWHLREAVDFVHRLREEVERTQRGYGG